MSIINSRNIRTLFNNYIGSRSLHDACKDTAKTIAINTVSLASNQIVNKSIDTVTNEAQSLYQSVLDTPVNSLIEVAQSNSVHETDNAFNYNPNNNQNFDYDLANQYMNSYNDYLKAKSYINQSQSNLAYQMFQKERNSINPSLKLK